MTPAQAFLNYRTFAINQLSPEKRAGWQDALGAAGDYIKENPWAQGALAGGALGGLTGIPSGNIVRNALYGAGIGGTIGGGKQLLDYLGNMPQQEQNSLNPNDPSFVGPPAPKEMPWPTEAEDSLPENAEQPQPAPPLPWPTEADDELPEGGLPTALAQRNRTDLGQQNLGQQRFV